MDISQNFDAFSEYINFKILDLECTFLFGLFIVRKTKIMTLFWFWEKKNVETADSFRFLARLNICILNGYLIGLVFKCGDVVLTFVLQFFENQTDLGLYLQYCTLLLSPCTELEVIVPIWEFSLKSRLGVSFRVIISVFCLFFSRPLNAYPMSIFVYNMGIHICIAMHH